VGSSVDVRIPNVSLRRFEWLILVEPRDLWPIGVQNMTGLNSTLLVENFTCENICKRD
jgi:hypothetical protein